MDKSATYDKLGVGSISNKDNSDAKQLRWEMDRESNFRRGGNRKGGRRNHGGKKADSFSKKKSGPGKVTKGAKKSAPKSGKSKKGGKSGPKKPRRK